MFLYGYSQQILLGTWETIKLALLSLLVAFFLGLLGASCKLSGSRILRFVATIYTTFIRSVPDLVLMLLLFFSLQMGLNNLTDLLGIGQIDIDPFVAGVLTIGFIYGAYFAETFRGAFKAIPKGQMEAGIGYGMSKYRVFKRILFPQMMRFALPGINNNWQVVLKSTALVSIIGLNDLVQITQAAGKATANMFLFILVAGLIYLLLTILSNIVLAYLERKYAVGVREAQL